MGKYNMQTNNFHENQKNSVVYTPDKLSEFLFEIVSPNIDKDGYVLDPCTGQGSLIKPFVKNGFKTLALDITDQGFEGTKITNYLESKPDFYPGKPSLVIMNPPFNLDDENKKALEHLNYRRRPLLPEVFLRYTLGLFGLEVPIVMFTSNGFRLGLTSRSTRFARACRGEFPDISTIVSLLTDTFENVCFTSEILMFNIKGMKPHYFLPDTFCETKGYVKKENEKIL